MTQTILQVLALVPALVFAIVFHEVSHGWTAKLLGDPTAQEQRRLSLNPIRHVDPVGTVILPGALALMGWPVFGWAKPVPVNKWRLRNPRFGMMAVAIAGPGSNLVLAAIGAALLGLLVGWFAATPADASQFLGQMFAGLEQGYLPGIASLPGFAIVSLTFFVMINIFLALFNLLPIPPFDGSHIVEGLLPRAAAKLYARLRPYGLALVFLILLVLPALIPGFDVIGRYVAPPVEWAEAQYFALAGWFAGV